MSGLKHLHGKGLRSLGIVKPDTAGIGSADRPGLHERDAQAPEIVMACFRSRGPDQKNAVGATRDKRPDLFGFPNFVVTAAGNEQCHAAFRQHFLKGLQAAREDRIFHGGDNGADRICPLRR